MNFQHSFEEWLEKDIPFESVDPEAKWHQIVRYADQYENVVETGTAQGVTTGVLAAHFKKVWTIELREEYYNTARVTLKDIKNVKMVKGSSAQKLLDVIKQVNAPAVYYLDGHYSGPGTGQDFNIQTPDTPILVEMEALSRSKYNNVVIIDDARLFKGQEWNDHRFAQYPDLETLGEIVDRFKVPSTIWRELDAFIVEPK